MILIKVLILLYQDSRHLNKNYLIQLEKVAEAHYFLFEGIKKSLKEFF